MRGWRCACPSAAASLALSLAALSCVGPKPAAAAEEPAARAQLEQKLRLTFGLISDSPAVQRIVASGSPQAVSHLDEGRVHHALAAELLARGDLAGAGREVDNALRHLGLARRMVPDTQSRQAAARLRHEQLLGSVQRLIEAWRARAGSTAAGDGDDLVAALGLVGTAGQLAQEGRFDEANQALANAEWHVLAGMNRTLRAATLDYTPRPTSAQEEFQHELARHRAFAELLPLAIRDLKPRPDALALVARYGETGNTLQSQALQQFQAGDIAQALVHVRNATLYVQRALSAAGLVAPQPTGTPP